MTETAPPSDRPPVSGRTGAIALLTAGVLFLLYPALRPWGDQTPGLASAQAFAEPLWPLSHYAGVLGFMLVPVGLLAVHARIGGRLATVALATIWLGVGLVLPFYGAEAFALHAVGMHVVASGEIPLLSLVDAVRDGSLQVTTFGLGLLLLGLGALLTSVAVWRSRGMPRGSAVLFAAGFVLYLPQFFGPPALRIAHGALVLIGCAVLALALVRRPASS